MNLSIDFFSVLLVWFQLHVHYSLNSGILIKYFWLIMSDNLFFFSPIKLSTLEKFENAAYCEIVSNCKNPPVLVYCNKGL